MDGPTARTLTTALVVIAAATLLARTLTAPESLDNNNRKQSRRRRSKNDSLDPQYVTGLVNVGNTCFMNSVLQAMASLPSLRSYLEARKDMGHEQESITLALYETIEMLNVHHRRQTAQRLVRMVKAVKAKAAQVLTSQQQDAQELFQILSSQLSEECEKLDHPGTLSLLDRMTVSEILNPSPSTHMKRRPSVSSVMFSSLSSIHNNKFQKSPPSSPDAIENTNGNGTEGDSNTDPVMTESLVLDRIEQDKYRRAKSPFMGLLASRVSCVDCGYTAAIRHSTFDNLSLTVPLQYACCLEDCLESFIHLDTISDFKCRKCTLIKASKDLAVRIEQCKTSLRNSQERNDDQHGDQDLQDQHKQFKQDRNANRRHQRRRPSPAAANTTMDEDFEIATSTESSLLRLEELKSLIDQCLFGDIEMDLAPIELEPVQSKRTTKHSMIAKPPQTLCLHLNRSMFTDQGQMAKNPCRVQFGSWLDFTRFTTSGYLTTVATKSMSRRGSAAVSTISSEGSNGAMGFMNTGAGVSTGIASMFPPRGGLRRPSLAAPWPSSVVNASLKVGANAAREGSSPDQEMDNPQDEEGDERVLYRLCAVVEHLGSHNSGHFVTYRRIPSSYSGRVSSSSSRLTNGKRRSGADVNDNQDQWWRISDENVQIVEWAIVKNAEAYMLFYEKERAVV